MNRTNAAPKGEKRFRPLRLIIACTLIALLLVSTSIGLSYARYKNTAAISNEVNFTDLNFKHAPNVVIAYIDRNDTTLAPIVLKYNADNDDKDEVIVTVPRGLEAEETCIAYALSVSSYSEPVYDIVSGTYQVSASMRLFGLSYPSSTEVEETAVVASEDNKIKLQIKAWGIETATSSFSTPIEVESYFAVFPSVESIGTTTDDAVVDVSFNKKNWIDSANTEWYESNPSAAEYEIKNASELAGLAKLVNGDPENGIPGIDFSGVTFTLANDISLYGSDGEGDIREWTPIGTVDNPFKGSFDGNGMTITGLTLSGGIAADNVGLFGVADGDADSYIKNLTLSNPAVYVKDGKYTGTVIGKATGYQLSGVTVDNLNINGQTVGGTLVGQVNGPFVKADDCSVTLHDDSFDGYEYIGEDNSDAAQSNITATEDYETEIH
ncbi:MAG: hypothetical protein IJH07_08735 [Ruminococcus sp.]|nr:hypothetical protein [Ruminococcus sp.]